MEDWPAIEKLRGGDGVYAASRALAKNLESTRKAMAAISNLPGIQQARLRADTSLMDAAYARKSRAEQATIDGAERTQLLVDAVTKQAILLEQLLDEQRRGAKSNRRWRTLTIVSTCCAVVSTVVAVIAITG